MGEIQIFDSQHELLESLVVFDPQIGSRVEEIQAGFSPNGEHPNGVLSSVIENGGDADHEAFISEYGWGLSILIYPYREKEELEALMSTAEGGLYIAAATYNSDVEPNFLKHIDATVKECLQEEYGYVDTSGLPSLDKLEEFVRGKQRAGEPKPFRRELVDEEEPTIHIVPSRFIKKPAEPVKDSLDYIEYLGPKKTLAAYRAGELTRHELTLWAARYPDEVPTVNGEFEWIALNLADYD